MKKMFVILIIISSIILLLPLSVMSKNEETKSVEMSNTSLKVEKEQKDTFNVLDKQSGKVVKMDVGEYIFSVVAAEMPALYEKEAIKAQAVAAYTFALIRKNENSDKEYDITTDFTVDQSFISREDVRKKWGDKADEYENKIEGAIEDVKGYKVTYNGELALTVYHALSCGKTESSENVWGKAFPYLEPVLSEWDKLHSDYISEETFSATEIKEKFGEIDFKGEEKNYFTNLSKTKSGMVKSISVCGKEMSGNEVRSVLNLRSASFETEYSEGGFKFTVYGYGHSVGMSQYGADCMAKQGSDFKEILTYYYNGCKIKK